MARTKTTETTTANTEETAVRTPEKVSEINVLITSRQDALTIRTAILSLKEHNAKRVGKLRKQAVKAEEAGRHAHAEERRDLADLKAAKLDGQFDSLVAIFTEAADQLV